MRPNNDDTYNLIEAAMDGNAQRVKQCIPNADATIQSNRALRHAVNRGHTQCVELLLPVSDLSDDVAYDELVLDAIEHGYTACVKALLNAANVTFDPYLSVMYFLMCAVSNEKLDLVRFFVPKALHKIERDERWRYKIIQYSVLKPNEDIFQELLMFSDPVLAWEDLQRQGRTKEECFLLVEHLERMQQNATIYNAVEHHTASPHPRKI